MSRSYYDFANRLREERKRKQLTQRTMSVAARIHPSHYLKVESGYARFSLCELQGICSVGLDAYYIFTGRKGVDISQYEELFKDVDEKQMFHCLKMIQLVAGFKRIKGFYKKEGEDIFLATRYLGYVNLEPDEDSSIFKICRKYHEVSQMDMAESLGIDVKKMRALENNILIPDSEIILKMYEKYGISPSFFLQNKKCIQSEIAYLLNNCSHDVGNELLILIHTGLLFFR